MAFRKVLVKIGVSFFAILLLLIFLSGTISRFSLPSVSVDTMQERVVNKKAWGHGYAAFQNVETYWADNSGSIEWHVQDGDVIEPGQALFTLTGDITELEDTLSEMRYQRELTSLLASQADAAEHSLYALQLTKLEADIQKLEEKLTDQQERIVYYEGAENGYVSLERFENNRTVAEGTKLLSVSILNRKYRVDAIIVDNPDFLQAGTGATLTLAKQGKTIDIGGVVKRIYIDEGVQHAVIDFTTDHITGGESIQVLVQTPRELEPTVLPSVAIRTDGRDHYVFYVERQQERFGEAYYIRKLPVTVGYVYDAYTALVYYDAVQYPFVVNSDRLIQEGDRVNIVNGSDFFEEE